MVRYWDYEYKVRGTQYSPFLVTNIDNRVVSSGPERRTRERKAVPYVPPPQEVTCGTGDAKGCSSPRVLTGITSGFISLTTSMMMGKAESVARKGVQKGSRPVLTCLLPM